MLRSANIRFSLRFSSSMAVIWLTMDASVTRQGFAEQKPERACHHTLLATYRRTHCTYHVHCTDQPPAHRLHPVAGSQGSGVRCILSSSFEISSCILPRKFYFRSPLLSGGDYPPAKQANICHRPQEKSNSRFRALSVAVTRRLTQVPRFFLGSIWALVPARDFVNLCHPYMACIA
jgi:hypothetical protein